MVYFEKITDLKYTSNNIASYKDNKKQCSLHFLFESSFEKAERVCV